ncbi:MAG: transporter associated domain-containing protein, partial [Burkholderiaceae bacterium]
LSDEQVDTIGGYVTDHLGRVPRKGETVGLEGFEFEIQRADARTVQMLLVKRLEEASEADPSKPQEDAGLAA